MLNKTSKPTQVQQGAYIEETIDNESNLKLGRAEFTYGKHSQYKRISFRHFDGY